MSHPSNFGSSSGNNAKDEATMQGAAPVQKGDLVELFLKPLAAQIDRTRLEIIERIEKLNESTDIIARQIRRNIDCPKSDDNEIGAGVHDR